METIKDSWTKLDSNRGSSLMTARECSALTLPHLLPPEGHKDNAALPTPYQSLGARGVNNLTSKMLMALFPTNTPFFRFSINPALIEEIAQNDMEEAIDEAMRKRENKLLRRVETGNLRSTLGNALKHLIVAGNGLIHLPKTGNSRLYNLTQYVVVRDALGNVTKVIIKESAHPNTLPDNVQAICKIPGEDKDPVDQAEIYTCMELNAEGGYEWHQEINDIEVPGSKGSAPKGETPPYVPLRWQAISGSDYGVGLVEEYLGDLRSLEGLTASVVDFAAVAAKIVLLLHPNAATQLNDLKNASSGDVVVGDLKDLDVFQLDKYADFKVAKEVIDDLSLRLSHVFLLQSGTVRDAERVTAAEISAMAQELEDVLGGVYTVMSQELQLPLVKRLISAGNFKKFPKIDGEESIDPVIVTGFEALGRGHELNKLRAYIQDLVGTVGEEVAASLIDPQKAAKQLGLGHNIDVSDILKSQEQIDADNNQKQQAQLAQTLTEKGTGPAISAAAQTMKP